MVGGAQEAPQSPFDPAAWSGELAARWERLAEELRRRLGPGVPLEPGVRHRFEARLGSDLSGAVLHRGALPGRLAAALGAEALAAGSHVLGDARRLDPATRQGAALLGHELTHVAGAPRHADPPPMHLRPRFAGTRRHDDTGTRGHADTETRGGVAPPPLAAPPPAASPLALSAPAVQRAVVADEAAALSVEQGMLQAPRGTRRRPVDVQALAERVYTRLVDAYQLERERAPW
jgi:hypothetical protein